MTTTTEKPDPYSYLTLTPEAQNLFSDAASDLSTFATGTYRSSNTKVITVIFDGTGQNKDATVPEGETTSVAAAMQKNLYDQALADGGSSVEPVYVRGIGSPPANSTNAGLVDGALALTAKKRLDEAWRGYMERAQAILAEDPTANIQVNVVGFSRGAALAREFMNRVDELGVPSDSTPISYSNGELNCNAVTYSYGELSRKGGEVKQTALLFDTVATSMNTVLEPESLLDPASSGNSVTTVADSTYVPIRLSIPDSVNSVVHFMSANDTRDTLFRPTSIQASGSGAEPDPRFAEIVLPGVHSDIGGTFNEGPQAYMKALGLQVLKNYGVYDGPVELPTLPTQITNYNATRNLFTGDTRPVQYLRANEPLSSQRAAEIAAIHVNDGEHASFFGKAIERFKLYAMKGLEAALDFVVGTAHADEVPRVRAQSDYDALRAALAQAQGTAPPPKYDPLIVDLDHNGLTTTTVANGSHFDMVGDGFAEQTAWVGIGDALLVRDLNVNGTIDTGAELFGDQTLLASGLKAANGFLALADLDSTHDGQFSAQDAAWGEVKLWKDDGDAVTEEGELLTLAEADVQAIQLNYSSPNTTDAAGNTLAQYNATSVLNTDGSTSSAGSFLLRSDPMDTLPTDYLDLTESIAALPELIGAGKAYDLSQAMVRDSTLEAMVTTLAGSTDYDTLATQFDAILVQWAGATAVTAGSRGAFIDAKHLAVVEKFYGQGFVGVGGANPNQNAAPIIETAYQEFKAGLFAQFLAQAQLKPYWDEVSISWDATTEGVVLDYAAVAAKFHQELGGAPTAAVSLLWNFAQAAKGLGLTTTSEFADFKASFANSAGLYDKVIDAGLNGVPVLVDYAGDGVVTLTAAGMAYGLVGDDLLQGSAGADVLVGGEGNDVLDGGGGADLLQGGDGSDTLGGANSAERYGAGTSGDPWRLKAVAPVFTGNTYEGGAGDDVLNGTYGSDTYRFNLGDGSDTIFEMGLSPASGYTAPSPGHAVTDQGDDVLVFGDGINPADVTVTRIGNDVVFTLANSTDKVTVKDWLADATSGKKLATVQFADGTTWTTADVTARALQVQGTEGNDTLTGVASFANVLDGGTGNDALTGNNLGDTLVGGAGNDTLDGGAGEDLLQGGEGDDVLGGNNSLERYGYAQYGSLTAGGAGDPWYWYATAPKFVGNTYEGGAGNDTLNGTYGSDTYRFNLGDSADTIFEMGLSPAGYTGKHGVTDQGDDVLVFGEGINPADVTVTRIGNDVVFTLANGTDKVTVKDWLADTTSGKKLAAVRFADGTAWATADVTTRALHVQGTEGNDSMTGVANFANVLDGGAGNDVITGGNVANHLTGGGGNDVLAGGNGDDTLGGGDGNDVLDGGGGADLLQGGDGDDVLGGTNSTERYGAYSGNAHGDPWLYSAVAPKFTGNTYEGGAGNDTLNGTYGSDTYRFNLGDGADTIIEMALSPASGYVGSNPSHGVVDQGDDALVFGEGINPADVTLSKSGADLVLTLANGTDKVTVKNWFGASNGGFKLAQVTFADGTTWSEDFLSAHVEPIHGGAGNDVLTAPVAYWARSLFGHAGADTLTGNTGADWLSGGEGDDNLLGGLGNDTYLWNLGDGLDTVTDTGGLADVADFSGITVAMAQFFKGDTGSDLTINVGDAASGMVFKNQLLAGGQPVEQFKFADATLTAAEVQSMAILKV